MDRPNGQLYVSLYTWYALVGSLQLTLPTHRAFVCNLKSVITLLLHHLHWSSWFLVQRILKLFFSFEIFVRKCMPIVDQMPFHFVNWQFCVTAVKLFSVFSLTSVLAVFLNNLLNLTESLQLQQIRMINFTEWCFRMTECILASRKKIFLSVKNGTLH